VTLDVLIEERNVSRAAARLGLIQSVMSRALGRLRAALGDPLLVPARRGLEPTPCALALVGPLREILAGVRAQVLAPAVFDPTTA
jgi:DNA-binding transcriptional LysR family regulator